MRAEGHFREGASEKQRMCETRLRLDHCVLGTVLGKPWEFSCLCQSLLQGSADGGPVAGWEGELERWERRRGPWTGHLEELGFPSEGAWEALASQKGCWREGLEVGSASALALE